MDRRQVAGALEEIAVLLEIAGADRFKSRAYVNAARAIESLDRDLTEVVASGELGKIKGVGRAIEEKVTTLVTTGTLPYLEDLRQRVPMGLRDLLRVPGLGPKRVKDLYEKVGIKSLGELEYAAQSKTLETLPGFGAKLQAKVLEGIAVVKLHAERHLLSEAWRIGEAVHARIATHPAVIRSALAGSMRRRAETVGDLDLVVATNDPPAITAALVAIPEARQTLVHGDTKSSVRLRGGIQVDLRAVNDREYPYLLHHSTGSKAHNVALRARAQARGLKINEYGLWRGDELVPCADEEEFYAALGLAYIPPELREGRGEIEAAECGALPQLLEPSDLQGVLHVHTVYSDGIHTVHEMALAARERGYRYVGFTDHSPSTTIANGMSIDTVRRQRAEIDRLNRELEGITLLQGTECDILPDGQLDYPEEILAGFDFVIGAVHSRFVMTEAEMTQRILTALESPYLDVLAHPTGRLLLAREPYALHLASVCEAAAARDVALEINAHPQRLDLDWRHVRGFRDRGGWVSINPDAHRTEGLDDVRYGVAMARKGWTTRERVLNALPLEELRARFRARRERIAT